MNFKSNLLTKSIIYFTVLFFISLCGILKAQIATNGAFENSDTGSVSSIEGWIVDKGTVNPPPDFIIVDDTVQSGNRALKVIVHAVGANAYSIQLVADSLQVEPGEQYRFSVWAKSDAAGGQIYFTVGNYSFSEYAADRSSILTSEWRRYTFVFEVTDNQTVIRAPFHLSIAANIGRTIYIDNFSITKVIDESESAKPIIVEAESGARGTDYESLVDPNDTTLNYVSVLSDGSDVGTFDSPGNNNRVITYEVSFPDTGTFNLFARVRVGPNRFDDDSFFYGNAFGVKDSADADDWINVNGLTTSGFADSGAYVNDPGGIEDGIWKWINLSKNNYQGEQAISFNITGDSLIKIFQIGGREDGLEIDKFAFGRSHLFYTVANLDNVEPGSEDMEGGDWEGPPLASKHFKFVGSAHSPVQAPNFQSYWNQVTPENAGKWGSVEGSRDVMNWGGVDAAYNLAKNNDFRFRFHVLIWGNQQPGWMENLSNNPDAQLEEIREWFQAVADRYDDIDYIEVVNEPLHDPPTAGNGNYINALGGSGSTGWDWILNAFRIAREIFQDSTKLLINDYNIVNSSSNTASYLNIIRLLQTENLIDGIGVQGHSFSISNASASTIKTNLDSLASTGLPIQVTEMDINNADDQLQLQIYQRVFPVFFEHPAVEGITLWGWKPGTWQPQAFLLNQNGTERPALQWMRDYLDTVNIIVSVDELAELPFEFKLFNNYPNPFNPTTNINYNIPKTSKVSLKVFDMLGRHVQTLVDDLQSAGSYSVKFSAGSIGNMPNLSSGIYFYRLEATPTGGQAGDFVETKKLILMK